MSVSKPMEHATAALTLVAAYMKQMRPLEYVGAATLLFGLYGVVQALRLWQSDCDLQVAAASRQMPRTAFHGKTVWIVGASSGIGEALAYELAKRGATLILSARRVEALKAMVERCTSLGSPRVHVQPLDVTAFDSHAAAVQAVYAVFPVVHYLVNNAGRSQRGLAHTTPLSVDREMWELNVLGALSVTKAVLPRMLAQGEQGAVAFTSSVAGKVGSPISASYAGTKHALQGWTDSARMELQGKGVRFLSICPGPVHSEITLHAFTDTPGKALGVRESDSGRMSAERCAHLYAAALWAKLPECWMAPQPILTFTYLGQYWRQLYFWLGPHKIGPARVKAFLGGQTGYGSITNLGKVLGSESGKQA